MQCNKCKNEEFIVYEDKVNDKMTLYICKNKKCANAAFKYEMEEGTINEI